jgi:glycosyltransferase involved in cell wall biosynthesis
MPSKRILIFSLAYHPVIGGAEVAVKEITDRISEIEWEMVTIRFDKTHKSEEKIGNVKVYRIDSSKILFPIEAYLFAKRLHEKNPYDAIWAIMAARAGARAGAAALFFKYAYPKVKYLLNLQEGDPIWYMKLRSLHYINPFFRKIFTNADIVQAISNYLADYAHIMGYKGHVEVIPNGIDIERFKNRNPREKNADKIKLITTSRLVGKNGVGDIIRSLEFLPPNVKLQIIGTGSLEEKLKQDVRDKNLGERVEFLGHVANEEIPNYLHRADIFIRPSLSEGLGISFLEAMAAGLPVIATPVGGIVDFLKDGETGLFCDVKNPQSIARQVKRLMIEPGLRAKLIENGEKLVREKYEWDLLARKMVEKVFCVN